AKISTQKKQYVDKVTSDNEKVNNVVGKSLIGEPVPTHKVKNARGIKNII
ncbi:MAG: hypothetical protein SCARUB_05209, partial [Candidatus Scalindua rubra]